ncbi:MAG TPA: histone-like protein 2, partial [Anaerolineae bacterium]|nr:histone-like protein 2 [Anaerolineae bacterium]
KPAASKAAAKDRKRTKTASPEEGIKSTGAKKAAAKDRVVKASEGKEEPAENAAPERESDKAEQIPLPLKSAPSKKTTKTSTRKKKTVRSIPDS